MSVILRERDYNMETKKNKIIFGLSPKAALINAFLLLLLSQIFWALVFFQQFPDGMDLSNIPTDFKVDNVPWYYTLPLSLLSMIIISSWIQYKYDVPRGDFSLRTLKYDAYMIGGFIIVSSIMRFFVIIVYTLI